MRPPLTTVEQADHIAAAAYLMKRAGTTALMVLDAQTGHPAGIITEADIAHAVADGKDVNSTRIHALMTARPTVVSTTTSVRDAAEVMTSGHFRHLPVVGDEGLVGIVDITDVCRALLEPGVSRLPPAWRSRSSPRGTFTGPFCRLGRTGTRRYQQQRAQRVHPHPDEALLGPQGQGDRPGRERWSLPVHPPGSIRSAQALAP